MQELGSEVAGDGEDSQQTQPKTKNPIVLTGRPVLAEQPSRSSAQEIDNRVLRGCESTDVSSERSDRDKDADENVDADQTSTERPVESGQSTGLFTQREEIDIDFRVSGLPHAVVKQTENFRVRELVKKMESHTHREALQADLQQSDVYNQFSEKSKKMIRDMGNVELFELCETIPKVQCSECLLCWSQGVICCTCGHLLVESESIQHFHKWRLDALSIPFYVIKKGRPRGARHGKTDAQKQLFMAHNARRRRIKNNFDGFHDRFQRDPVYRVSQHKIGWTEEKCIEMDKFAQDGHSYRLSCEEYERYQKHWYLTLNKSGKNAPMRLRSDFRKAVTIMNCLHRESGEERAEPVPSQQYQRWHSSSSSSSTSWWQWNENCKNARKKLETSVAPAMPCKIMKNCWRGASNKIKTKKLACVLEADESTRMRMGNSIPHYHQDHISGRGENSLQHYNLVHKFIPMPQAMKIPAAEAAVDKE